MLPTRARAFTLEAVDVNVMVPVAAATEKLPDTVVFPARDRAVADDWVDVSLRVLPPPATSNELVTRVLPFK